MPDSLLVQKANHDIFLGINENWWTHIILPIAIPIIAFLLLRLRDKLKELKHLKAKQKFIFTWIDLIDEQIKKQTDSYISYSVQLKSLEPPKGGLNKYNLFIEKLEYYNSEELIKLFVKSRRLKNAKVLNELLFKYENSVNFIKRKLESTTSLVKKLKSIYSDTSTMWNENFYKLRTLLHRMSIIYESGDGNEAIKQILKLYSEFINQKEGGMDATMNNFITPAGGIANDDINNTPGNVIMRELVECLVQLKNIYASRKKNFEGISDLFIEASEKINENFKKIKEVKTILTNYPFKNVLFI